jgi:alpha-galactosidase
VRMRATVRNIGADLLDVEEVMLALPVPSAAVELLDLTGRHLRERSPQRSPFLFGQRIRENRRGRTGLDAALMMVAGEAGFGFRRGQVWALHPAWSGNHRLLAERSVDGAALLGGSELLLAGEVRLPPGDAHTTPWMLGSHGTGLDELSARFHRFLTRTPVRPRPVTMNTWEAVYFEQSLPRLTALAERAAAVGCERFVLDDGWFRGRRDDTAGLGDWQVDADVWPDGLDPLIERVNELGMEFGLWVEPEMINPDSDLARDHPEWILAPGDRLPGTSRNQWVLNLGHPDAYRYIFAALDDLLTRYRIAYLKWDHNRDLIEAGHRVTGTAGVHDQTVAVYRLIDELRARHPDLEIESCSSGGGRVDAAILQRTERIWTSDCIDALERQQIQRWTQLLVPSRMLGAHVGSPEAHSTGRRHTLAFRAGTAFFGHLGVEWDLTTATDGELAELRNWIAEHRRLRNLLHTGTVVRSDHPDPALWLHGVVSPDRDRAVFAIVRLGTSVAAQPDHVMVPGLDPDRSYRVTPLDPSGQHPKPWAPTRPLIGRVLELVGILPPVMNPESLVLFELTDIAADRMVTGEHPREP